MTHSGLQQYSIKRHITLVNEAMFGEDHVTPQSTVFIVSFSRYVRLLYVPTCIVWAMATASTALKHLGEFHALTATVY